MTFERAAGRPFDQQTIDIADAVASILEPALHDKRLNDRSIFVKCGDALAAQAQRLLGPGYYGRKLAVAAAAAVVVFFYFATGPYRISADGKVEGEVRRSIVARSMGSSAKRRHAPATLCAGAIFSRRLTTVTSCSSACVG